MNILNEKGVKTQQIGGTHYVYRDKPYWDKSKKQNRHAREYIGKLDEGGTFIPNKEYLRCQNEKELGENSTFQSSVASRKFFGAVHLLNYISENTGLKQDLFKVFGAKLGKKIMSLAYFLVLEGESSMYRFRKFAKTHKHPYELPISSQQISDIFAGISEQEKTAFFSLWAKRCLKEEEYLAYDTTSISSYSEMMKQVKFGKNKDSDNLAQINLALLFGEKSKLPVYYRKMPGNINDVSAVKKMLADISFLGINKANFVLDRGFYSKENVDNLYKNHHKFLIAGRSNTDIYKNFISDISERITEFANYSIEHDLYCTTKETRWNYEYEDRQGKKQTKKKIIYLHGYFDSARAEREKNSFLKKLKLAQEAFNLGNHTDKEKSLIKRFFIVTDCENCTLKNHNQEAIEAHLKTFGFFMLLSNNIKGATEALSVYRNKDVAEKAFFNIKNRLDMKRTKVSLEESLEGKLFLQFIALIYISYIHQTISSHDLYKNYSMASLLDEIDVIEIFEYQNKKTHFSEITKKQRTLLECFGVSF